MEINIKALGERVKEIRKELKLSQGDFGKQLGVQNHVIYNLESGRNKTINETLLIFMCNQYGICKDWLFYGIGNKFIENSDSLLTQLKNKYNLSNLEYKIFESYLNLDCEQRKAVEDFINEILSPEPPSNKSNDDYTTLAAARGNSNLEIVSDDDAVRKDLENYIPPTDL